MYGLPEQVVVEASLVVIVKLCSYGLSVLSLHGMYHHVVTHDLHQHPLDYFPYFRIYQLSHLLMFVCHCFEIYVLFI